MAPILSHHVGAALCFLFEEGRQWNAQYSEARTQIREIFFTVGISFSLLVYTVFCCCLPLSDPAVTLVQALLDLASASRITGAPSLRSMLASVVGPKETVLLARGACTAIPSGRTEDRVTPSTKIFLLLLDGVTGGRWCR